MFNSFLANVPILYPLKTPENQRFSGVFREYKMRTLARDGLINTHLKKKIGHNLLFFEIIFLFPAFRFEAHLSKK